MPDASTTTTTTWLIGPLIGGLIGYWLKGFEAKRSETQARLDEVIKEVQLVVSVAKKYWSLNRDAESKAAEHIEQESEIVGRLHWANVVLVHTKPFILDKDYDTLSALLLNLRKKATGGAFASAERQEDPNRIRSLFVSAGKLTTELRGVARYCFTTRFAVRHNWQKLCYFSNKIVRLTHREQQVAADPPRLKKRGKN